MIKSHLCVSDASLNVDLTLEGVRGGGGNQSDPPSIFLALNFCSLTNY